LGDGIAVLAEHLLCRAHGRLAELLLGFSAAGLETEAHSQHLQPAGRRGGLLLHLLEHLQMPRDRGEGGAAVRRPECDGHAPLLEGERAPGSGLGVRRGRGTGPDREDPRPCLGGARDVLAGPTENVEPAHRVQQQDLIPREVDRSVVGPRIVDLDDLVAELQTPVEQISGATPVQALRCEETRGETGEEVLTDHWALTSWTRRSSASTWEPMWSTQSARFSHDSCTGSASSPRRISRKPLMPSSSRNSGQSRGDSIVA